MRGRRGGLGGVQGQRESGVGEHVHALVGQVEVADVAVVEGLGARAVVSDVVGAPTAAELLAAGGDLTDEVVQLPVVGIASRCRNVNRTKFGGSPSGAVS